jgi:fructose/tagatose bisphosphate aldolase
MNPKYFIGPMSKNVVDTIIDFCNETNNYIGLIPSRRQIEYNGGYVNNWTTKEFSEYVTEKTNKIILKRDHSGPKQGAFDDDGIVSLISDCKYLDYIHIDPWKCFNDLEEGITSTITLIKLCYAINPNIKFEIGTEQAIRPFNVNELETLINTLQQTLSPLEFKAIEYLVIQSGTSLKGVIQTGQYDKDRLIEMVNLAKKYNFISKEHNGDYIPVSIIKEKFNLGLDSINIAPEFGLLETQTYIDEIKDNEMIETYFQICYDSKKWVKWVDADFDPFSNKIELIKICGHYVLSNPEFLTKIKANIPNIDSKIKTNIKNKLYSLYETY